MKFMKSIPAVAWAVMALLPGAGNAQTYPDKPIKTIVAYSPGGPSDIYTRMLTSELTDKLKQTFVVENRPGAGGVIGFSALAQAPADGYTIGTGGLPFVGAIFNKNPPYNVETDFEPVAGIYSGPFYLFVSADLPVKNLSELVQYAKQHPGQLNFSAGSSSSLLLGELLKSQTGTEMLAVRYKGNAPALQAALRNEIQVGFDQFASLKPFVDGGKIKLIATTADRRDALSPNVPTVSEEGFPGLTCISTSTVIVRVGTPPAVKERLNAAVRSVVDTPAFAEQLKKTGVVPYSPTLAEVKLQVQRENAFWKNAAKVANYQPE